MNTPYTFYEKTFDDILHYSAMNELKEGDFGLNEKEQKAANNLITLCKNIMQELECKATTNE